MKTSVRIGAFEIDDAELHGESPGERTLTIPVNPIRIYVCNWTPGMPKPAFPPFSTGNIPFCSVIITILNLMPGSCVLPDSKRTRRQAGYLFFLFSFPPCTNLSYTIV